MAFNTAHRALADAAMQVEAYRLYGRRASIPQSVVNASYQASYRDDQRARPGSAKGWYEATANSTNRAIVEEANNAVQRAFRANRVSFDGVDAAIAAPTLAAFAAANVDGGEVTAQPVEISRRAMLGMGAAAAGFALLAPTQAAADNTGYISTVRRGVQSHVRSTAPNIIRGVGAGIRGNFELSPSDLQAPKGPVQA
jgi:hypothetical protein